MDKSYLWKRHNVYWVRVRVPDKVRNIIGKSELVTIDAIASTTKPIWGFQTHIEATQAFVNEHHIPVKNPKACFNFGQSILDQFILSL